MKLNRILSALVVAGASVSAQAGVYLSEGFDNVATLGASGWAQASNGAGAGSGWFQGNPGIFPAAAGAPSAYAAANFVDSVSSIGDWLMTPVLSVGDGAQLSFMLHLLGEGFLDTVEVYASNAGASTNTADFTLQATFSSDTDTGWQSQLLSLSAMTGRIGFRYYVANTATDGNYVGLDSVSVVPEPASLALVGLALAAGAAARRRRA